MYFAKVFLINIRDIEERCVALTTLGGALDVLDLLQDFRAPALKQLAVTVVVFEFDSVLLHDVVVYELR